MGTIRLFCFFSLFFAFAAQAAPEYFTYEGYLEKQVNSEFVPVDGAETLTFEVMGQIGTSGPLCVLYAESQSVTFTSGQFAARIGKGAAIFAPPGGWASMYNSTSSSVVGFVPNGTTSTPCTFDATAATARRLVRASLGSEVIGSIVMSSAPMAVVAQTAENADKAAKVGAFTPEMLLRFDGNTTQLPVAKFAVLQSLLSLNGVGDLVKKSDVPTCAAGQVLTAGSGGALSCVADKDAFAAFAACADGKILKKVSGAWVCEDLPAAVSETDPTVAAYAKRAPGSGLVVNGSNDITVDFGTGAGKVVQGNDSRLADSRAPNGSAGNDLTGSYPNPTVAKIRGNNVATTTPQAGQIYQWVGGGTDEWQPKYVSFADLKKLDGTSQMPSTCAANETLSWSAITDVFTCSAIGSLDASKITSGTLAYAHLPVGTTASTVAAGDDDRFPSTSCSSGQKSRWNGTQWLCETDSSTDSTKVSKSGGDTMTGSYTITGSLGVSTSVKFGMDSATCSAANAGSQRYNGGAMEYCNSSTWVTYGVSGSGIVSLTGDVTATGPGAAAATVAQVGGVAAADIASGANAANAATNTNTTSAIVKRDASGNFSAGSITATSFNGTLAGNVATLTTKGDLLTSTGTANARQPIGADGNVLFADSTQTTGLKWRNFAIGDIRSSMGGTFLTGTGCTTGQALVYASGTDSMTCSPIASTMPSIGSKNLLANKTGVSAAAADTTLSELLDANYSTTQGQMIYRGPSGWTTLAPSTDGYVIRQVSGVPAWTDITSNIASITAPANSDLTLSAGTGAAQNVKLNATGTGKVIANSTMQAPTFYATAGSLGSPAFGTATGYGMIFPGANSLGLVTNSLERLHIDSAGNVGIGATSLSAKLTIAGDATVRDTLFGASTNQDVYIRAGTAAGKIVIGDQNTGTVEMTGNGYKLINGNMGFGTTTPATRIELQGSSGTLLKIVDGNQGANKVLTSDANGVASWVSLPGASMAAGGSAGQIQFNNSGTLSGSSLLTYNSVSGAMTMTPSGGSTGLSVTASGGGSGTTGVYSSTLFGSLPVYSFYGTSVGYGVYGTSSGTSAVAGVAGYQTGVSNVGYGVYASNSSANGWSVYADGTSPSYFKGNVGIGTASPGNRLHVSSGSDSTPLKLETSSSAGGTYVSFVTSGRSWQVGPSTSTGNFNFVDSTASANRLTIDTTGNIGIGTTAPAEKLDLSGGNIAMGYQRVSAYCTSATSICSYTCSGTKRVVGGGCYHSSAYLQASYPDDVNSWTCRYGSAVANIYVYVICADIR